MPQAPVIPVDQIASELKSVPFPLSQFNPWQAALLTNRAIEAHLALLHQATGTTSKAAPAPDLPVSNWVQEIVAQTWNLAQRIKTTSPNEHLVWRSAEQIFRFGMAHNRGSYFLTPYYSLFFSWEPFGKETLPIYAREGAFLCQRFYPQETDYHLTAYYVGAFLYQAIKDPTTPAQHPVTLAYLEKLGQWAKENGGEKLLAKRIQRHAQTQATHFSVLQTSLWFAAYAAYTQDREPLVKLTLDASRELHEEQLIDMGEKLQRLTPCFQP